MNLCKDKQNSFQNQFIKALQASNQVIYSYCALLHMQYSKEHEQMNTALDFTELSDDMRNNILNNRDIIEERLCYYSSLINEIEKGGVNE